MSDTDTALAKLDAARRMLAQAKDVYDLIDIRDKAATVQAWIRRRDMSLDDENKAAELRILAEREIGRHLAETVQRGGDRRSKSVATTLITTIPAGISRDQSSQYQRMAAVPDDVLEEHIAKAGHAKERITTRSIVKLAPRLAPKRHAVDGPPPVITLMDCCDWLATEGEYDLLLTDPPYSTDVADIYAFADNWLPAALGHLAPTGRAYVFVGGYPHEIEAYVKTSMPDQILIWSYRNTMQGVPTGRSRYHQNWQAVLLYRGPDAPPLNCDRYDELTAATDVPHPARSADSVHAWQKPMSLAERFIRHATVEGQLVLDCFAGTGTHLLAAAKLGREARGCDTDESMIALAVERGCRREG